MPERGACSEEKGSELAQPYCWADWRGASILQEASSHWAGEFKGLEQSDPEGLDRGVSLVYWEASFCAGWGGM